MAFNFPNSPVDGQIFTPPGGPTFIWHSPAWISTSTLLPSPPTRVIMLTSGTVYTPSAGCRAFLVECLAGGGGGGGAQGTATTSAMGSGGGGGGCAAKYLVAPLKASYPYAIGAGGAGGAGANGNGGAGGVTTFDSPVICQGNPGSGGTSTGSTTLQVMLGGAGGSWAAGDWGIGGGAGGSAHVMAANWGVAGTGGAGAGPFGGGAATGRGNGTGPIAGLPGTPFGGGGSGGAGQQASTAAWAGGAGYQGAIRITEFFDGAIGPQGPVGPAGTVSVPIDAQNQRVLNVADPMAAQDAATKHYVDSLPLPNVIGVVMSNQTTTSTVEVMMGANLQITLRKSGMVIVAFAASVQNPTNGAWSSNSIHYGTGTPPVKDAAVVGAMMGGSFASASFLTSLTYQNLSQTVMGLLTPGQTYWFDVAKRVSSGSTGTWNPINLYVAEL